MAFTKLFEEEDKNKQPQQGQSFQTSSGVPTTIQGGAGGSSVSSAVPQVNKPSATKGSGFTNLKSYLDANKDESARMGGSISGQIGKENEAKIAGAGSSMSQALEAGRSQPAAKTLSSDALRGEKQQYSDAEKAEFRDVINQSYQKRAPGAGLTAEDYAPITSDISNQEKSAGSSSGLASMLRSSDLSKQSGNYGQGMVNLDSFILGQQDSGAGAKKISDQSKSDLSRFQGLLGQNQASWGTQEAAREAEANKAKEQTKQEYDRIVAQRRADLEAAKKEAQDPALNTRAVTRDEFVNKGTSTQGRLRALEELMGSASPDTFDFGKAWDDREAAMKEADRKMRETLPPAPTPAPPPPSPVAPAMPTNPFAAVKRTGTELSRFFKKAHADTKETVKKAASDVVDETSRGMTKISNTLGDVVGGIAGMGGGQSVSTEYMKKYTEAERKRLADEGYEWVDDPESIGGGYLRRKVTPIRDYDV